MNPNGDSIRDRVARVAGLMQFPSDYAVKVMGARVDDFSESMVAVLRRHAPDLDVSMVQLRASRQGNYLSVTATIRATSREQLEALYQELTTHPLVKVVL